MDLFTLAFPSAFALIIKGWLFIHARKSLLTKYNCNLTIFLLTLFILNLVEFVSFTSLDYIFQYSDPLIVLLLFYVAIIYTVSALICLSAKLSGVLTLYHPKVWYGLATFLAIITASTELVIVGIQPTEYSMTRIPGEYYWLFQIYMIAGLLLAAAILAAGVFLLEKGLKRKRCTILFVAILPFIAGTIGVVVAMKLGWQINATIVTSSTITIFLIVLIYTERESQLFKLLINIPGTKENTVHKKVGKIIYNVLSGTYKKQPIELRQTLQQIEETIIVCVLKEFDGSQTQASAYLGMALSTLNQKLTRLKNR